VIQWSEAHSFLPKLRDFQKIKSPNIHLPSISLIRAGRPCPYNSGEFIY
jgi:hypothetical protein